jgi:type I pantothenate kinase
MSPVAALAADLADRRPPSGPLIVGLTGAVAAGKSTLAGELKAALSGKAAVEIIATDGFLRPNAELTALGLLEQKGFPPTYDNDAFRAALNDIRSGRPSSRPIPTPPMTLTRPWPGPCPRRTY